MSDRIEKRIELNAPVSRVWRALTDHEQFGQWFRVNLETPFIPGKPTRGRLTYPAYEHLVMELVVTQMEPEHLFSFTWHPYPINMQKDYSQEPPTLVEFCLEKNGDGTLLLLTESGFDRIPEDRRLTAFRANDGGWTQQMKNIEDYVAQNP